MKKQIILDNEVDIVHLEVHEGGQDFVRNYDKRS